MGVNALFITLCLHGSSLLLVRRIFFSFLFVEQDIPLTTPGVFSGVLYWSVPALHFNHEESGKLSIASSGQPSSWIACEPSSLSVGHPQCNSSDPASLMKLLARLVLSHPLRTCYWTDLDKLTSQTWRYWNCMQNSGSNLSCQVHSAGQGSRVQHESLEHATIVARNEYAKLLATSQGRVMLMPRPQA